MSDVTWELSSEAKPQKVKKMAYKAPFKIEKTTTDGQKPVIDGWNEMQKCLIENGLMEPK